MRKLLALISLVALPVFGQDYQTGVIGPFGGLNNADSSIVIPSNQAQDLLNVDITPGGKSVKKRKGYAQAFALAVTTNAVHGVYSFYDASGNDVVLAFNDTRINASVAGASVDVIGSTFTVDQTWQCVDSQGYAYCAGTGRQGIIETEGTTFAFLSGFTSTGTILAVTPERLVQAGFSDAPNEIHFSSANDFSGWTLGDEPTDPIRFTITTPGARITHLTFAHKKVYWFKESSFGYILEGPELIDWRPVVVSYEIGSLDNTSTQDTDGNLYFRGQDGHIYMTDGGQVVKASKDIDGTVRTAQTRTSNSWIQTSQSDFEAGDVATDLSTTILAGDVTAKSTSFVLTSAADWGAGSFTGNTYFADTTTVSGTLQTTFPDAFDAFRDGTSGTKQVWTKTTSGSGSVSVSGGYIKVQSPNTGGSASVTSASSLNSSKNATYYFRLHDVEPCSGGNSTPGFSIVVGTMSCNYYFTVTSAGQINSLTTTFSDSSCPDLGTTVSDIGTPIDFTLWMGTGSFNMSIDGATTDGSKSGSHSLAFENSKVTLSASQLSFSDCTNGASDTYYTRFDSFAVVPQTFTWTSPGYDTGIVNPVWSTATATAVDDGGDIVFGSQVSSDNSSFDSSVALSTTALIASGDKRYLKVSSVFQHTSATSPVTSLSDFSFEAGSSGTYKSAVHQITAITAWDTFSTNQSVGDGSLTYYIRSSASSFAVTDVSPAWEAISPGGSIGIATGEYVQVRADFSATNNSPPSISLFSVGWFEGSADDKAYAFFHDDKVMFSVTAGDGATVNNRTLVLDQDIPGWTLYDLPSNGFYKRNNALYFGSSEGGYVYKFGDTHNDAGEEINAYWKSKDLFVENPFVDKEFVNLSVYAGVEQSTMTVTYTVNGSSASAFDVALNRANTSFVRSNKNLTSGRVGGTISVKFGNNAADQPWEVFAIQYGYRPRSWRPE